MRFVKFVRLCLLRQVLSVSWSPTQTREPRLISGYANHRWDKSQRGVAGIFKVFKEMFLLECWQFLFFLACVPLAPECVHNPVCTHPACHPRQEVCWGDDKVQRGSSRLPRQEQRTHRPAAWDQWVSADLLQVSRFWCRAEWEYLTRVINNFSQ